MTSLIKKSFIFFVLTVIIMLCTGTAAYADQLYYNDEYHFYDGGDIGISVNGNTLSGIPTPPVIIDDRTMVPVREVFEAIGSTVLWHDDTCQVEIINSGVSILIKIGDRNVYVNGELVQIQEDQPLPMLIGTTPEVLKSMVPVRFFAEKLGYTVGWDNAARTVTINTKDYENNIEISTPIEDGYGNFSDITAKSDSRYDYVYISTKFGISPVVTHYSSPERISLDFPGALFKRVGSSITLNGNAVSGVRYSNYNSQARVVLDLSDSAQICVMSSSAGIVIRAEKSPNSQIIYDAFARRVYFDKAYKGTGTPVENGYMVTFKDLNLKTQKIEIHDKIVYEIIIAQTQSGCTVTVDGSNNFSYSPKNGIVRDNDPNAPTTSNGIVADEYTVVIDAGHGGYDCGALGRNEKDVITAYESKINLAVAQKVQKLLESEGINVIMTRSTDKYVSLADRAAIEQNSPCDLFVSIHCNAIEDSSVNGTQVYYHPSSDMGTTLAKNIYKQMLSITGLAPKNIQNGSHLYVIRTTSSPAVLVETAFISNKKDREFLLSESGQQKIAQAITNGIKQTLIN